MSVVVGGFTAAVCGFPAGALSAVAGGFAGVLWGFAAGELSVVAGGFGGVLCTGGVVCEQRSDVQSTGSAKAANHAGFMKRYPSP